MRFYVEKCEAMRNFANKIWNASRFVMMNLTIDKNELPEKLELEDKWILSKLNAPGEGGHRQHGQLRAGRGRRQDLRLHLGRLLRLVYRADQGPPSGRRRGRQDPAPSRCWCYVLTETLKLLHPFMPFITEEIWQALPHEGDFLMLQKWPEYREKLNFQAAEEAMESVMDVIRAIRARRAEMNVPPSKKAAITIATPKAEVFAAGRGFLTRLAYASSIEIDQSEPTDTSGMVVDVTHDAKVYMPLAELVDIGKEKARLQKDLGKKQGELKGLEGKLSNPGFLNKAPENVVAAEKERAEKLKTLIAKLEEQLAAMG